MNPGEIVIEKLFNRTYKAVWLEYPTGQGQYGSGGWSSRAKHRPQPQRKEVITKDVDFKGNSVIVEGKTKRKLNLFDAVTGKVIRADYSLENELTKF